MSRRQIRDGQPVVFNTRIDGGDPKAVPVIIWNTSAGLITAGQGTRQITVDSSGAGSAPDSEIKAQVWVGGYAPECLLQASASVRVTPPASRFGNFGELPAKDVSANLKQLSDFLSRSRDNVWLIVYAGRNSENGFAASRAAKIKSELIANGLEPRRIIAIDGGYMEKPLFDFWIVPLGARPPQPKPTIDRSEIAKPVNSATRQRPSS
jgi:hypothetical protein